MDGHRLSAIRLLEAPGGFPLGDGAGAVEMSACRYGEDNGLCFSEVRAQECMLGGMAFACWLFKNCQALCRASAPLCLPAAGPAGAGRGFPSPGLGL